MSAFIVKKETINSIITYFNTKLHFNKGYYYPVQELNSKYALDDPNSATEKRIARN